MARKQIRVGTVTEVITPSTDWSGNFAATLKVAVQDDEGRDYFIHIRPEQIAALTQPVGDAEDIGTSVNARLDALAAEIQALRTK